MEKNLHVENCIVIGEGVDATESNMLVFRDRRFKAQYDSDKKLVGVTNLDGTPISSEDIAYMITEFVRLWSCYKHAVK